MGEAGPDRHDLEWLDEEPSPGRVRRLLDGRLPSRSAQGAAVVLAAVAVTVAVVTWPDGTEAQPPDEPRALSESLARSIDDASRDSERGHRPVVAWEIVGPVRLEIGAAGVVPSFTVVNRAAEPRRPMGVAVTGAFRGAPAVEYRARCRAVGTAAEEPVVPGDRVVVRCREVTPDRGHSRRLDRRSLQVVATEPACESEGRRAPS